MHLTTCVGLRTGFFQFRQVLLPILGALGDLGLGVVFYVLLFQKHFCFQGGQVVVAGFLIYRGDDVRREVDDALQVLWSQVQQVAQTGRNTLEVPDVGHWSGQFDVAHTLTAHLGLGHLNATALTNDAFVADTLVLAAGTFPVAGWSEDALTEQAVAFRLQGAVVNGFRLFDLALGPTADVVGSGKTNAEFVEEVYVKHVNALSPPMKEGLQ